MRRTLCASLCLLLASMAGCEQAPRGTVLTLSGSGVGAEGELLARQIARFRSLNPDIRVDLQRTPDDATQRHQLYVQWLNARVGNPDILQLDVVWTPEFAAAGWVLPLDRFSPAIHDYFPATLEANRWRGELYALPWFVDVGMLYWRTDLLDRAPESMEELIRFSRKGMDQGSVRTGHLWQGARYEGLITSFLEYLGGFGGRIMTPEGRIVVDSREAIHALSFMRDQIVEHGISPAEVLTWHEEEVRFGFQNGTSVFMRNWPYAYALLGDSSTSRVAGRFAVAPMPAAPGGEPTAALGGAQLAINAHTEHPDAAWRLLEFLTEPEQMLERAEVVGQFPPRRALYEHPRLAAALAVPPDQALRIVGRAVPRPITPLYTELSEILQIQLHRALVGQMAPEAALREAARSMNALIESTGIREYLSEPVGDG